MNDMISSVLHWHRTLPPFSYTWKGATVTWTGQVFHPLFAPSGLVMLQLASSRLFQGKRVLDLGCGSGLATASMVRHGGARSVVGVDIEPRAATAATALTDSLNLEFRIRILEGDLFKALEKGHATSSFDVIVANLPFAEGCPRCGLERAFFNEGLDTIKTLLSQVHHHLAPGGSLLLFWSSLAPFPVELLASEIYICGRATLPTRFPEFELYIYQVGLKMQSPTQPWLEEARRVLHDDRVLRSVDAIVSHAHARSAAPLHALARVWCDELKIHPLDTHFGSEASSITVL